MTVLLEDADQATTLRRAATLLLEAVEGTLPDLLAARLDEDYARSERTARDLRALAADLGGEEGADRLAARRGVDLVERECRDRLTEAVAGRVDGEALPDVDGVLDVLSACLSSRAPA